MEGASRKLVVLPSDLGFGLLTIIGNPDFNLHLTQSVDERKSSDFRSSKLLLLSVVT